MKLSNFQALSFDCYGTLIDWESGIYAALAPLLSRAGAPRQSSASADPSGPAAGQSHAGMGLSRSGVGLSRDDVLQAFARLEARQQEKTPDMIYPRVLAEVHSQLAIEWGCGVRPSRRRGVRSLYP